MRVGCLFLFAVLLLIPAVSAQEEPERFLYDFSLEGPADAFGPLAVGEQVEVELRMKDLSVDDLTLVGGSPTGSFIHVTTFEAEMVDGDERGWLLTTLPEFRTVSGQEASGSFRVTPQLTVASPYMKLKITGEMTDIRTQITVNRSITVSFFTPGQDVFSVQPRGSLDLAPEQEATMSLAINHRGLLPRTFEAELLSNPCNLGVVAIPTTIVPAQGVHEVVFSVQGPREKFWYQSEDCSVTMGVHAADNPNRVVTVSLSVTVNGNYVDPTWVMTAVAIGLAILFLVLIVLRRKAIIEEEILGKPQRPWTIPVERVYLKHLEARDARAAYVVRHFLMEEEYRSALLWYKSYKGATKGTRAKEGLVVAQEKSYKRFQKKWERKIARPVKKADRFALRLQKKLDRQAKANVRKDRRTWKKKVAKLEAKHEKRLAKQMQAWEKAVKKAEKRGEAAPPKPSTAGPDLPDKPELQKILLADHKWQKKAERKQRRMVRKQGNLEVRFEKKDARRLAKVRRKVHKIAKQIDDPEFVNEHPLLAESA